MTRTPAPPADCDHCGRRIGKHTTHYVTATSPPATLCARCMFNRATHTRYYPDCPDLWHQAADHPYANTSRAALPAVIDAATGRRTKPEDYPCPRCHATPGQQCIIRRSSGTGTAHAPRVDRAIRAQDRRDAIRPW